MWGGGTAGARPWNRIHAPPRPSILPAWEMEVEGSACLGGGLGSAERSATSPVGWGQPTHHPLGPCVPHQQGEAQGRETGLAGHPVSSPHHRAGPEALGPGPGASQGWWPRRCPGSTGRRPSSALPCCTCQGPAPRRKTCSCPADLPGPAELLFLHPPCPLRFLSQGKADGAPWGPGFSREPGAAGQPPGQSCPHGASPPAGRPQAQSGWHLRGSGAATAHGPRPPQPHPPAPSCCSPGAQAGQEEGKSGQEIPGRKPLPFP